MMALAFTALSLESFTIVDDCPCRRRVVKKVVKKQVAVIRVPVSHFSLFDSLVVPPEDFGCKRAGMQQVVNYRLKIMPNPVKEKLNVISFLEYDGMVKIELFTCEGKLITTLLNEYWTSGTNVRTFNLEGKLKRGIAYVRLTAGTVRQVEKIFVL